MLALVACGGAQKVPPPSSDPTAFPTVLPTSKPAPCELVGKEITLPRDLLMYGDSRGTPDRGDYTVLEKGVTITVQEVYVAFDDATYLRVDDQYAERGLRWIVIYAADKDSPWLQLGEICP